MVWKILSVHPSFTHLYTADCSGRTERMSPVNKWNRRLTVHCTDPLGEQSRAKKCSHVLDWHCKSLIYSLANLEKIKTEYLRRAKKLLNTKLYHRNLIKRRITWADPLVRYSRAFLKRTWEELLSKWPNGRQDKLMTMNNAFHLRGDIDMKRRRNRTLTRIEEGINDSRTTLKRAKKN